MKKLLFMIVSLFTLQLIVAENLEEKLEKMLKDNAKGYLQPFANAQSSALGNGFYQTADVLKPLRFGVMLNTTMAFIPSDDKTFDAEVINLSGGAGSLEDVESATIFGDKGEGGLPDGLDVSIFPFVYPQINLGIGFGSEINLRFLPSIEIDEELGEFSFWGIGVKHDLDKYLTGLFPFHIAAQMMYQNMKVTDALEISNFSADLLISKSLVGITLYGGAGIRSNTVDVNYEYKPEETLGDTSVNFELETDNKFAFTVGSRFSLLLFRYYVEGSYDGYVSARTGLGFSF